MKPVVVTVVAVIVTVVAASVTVVAVFVVVVRVGENVLFPSVVVPAPFVSIVTVQIHIRVHP